MMTEPAANRGLFCAFQVEAGSLEEFLTLLQGREGERAYNEAGGLSETELLPRRAVFVSPLYDRRDTRMAGAPVVRRYVLAGFAYGADLVSFEKTTSHDLEIRGAASGPESSEERQERHIEAYEGLKEELREKIRAVGLEPHVPVLDGFLRHAGGRPETRA